MKKNILKRLLDFDRSFHSESGEGGGGECIAGVDEAGRGPLAGPVVAAAVIFFRKKILDARLKSPLSGLNDSKQIAPARRNLLFNQILKNAVIGVGRVDEEHIDLLNIYQATRLAMKRAVLSLSRTPDLLLIDGNMRLDLPVPQRAIIDGDAKSASIAAASIIAKVYRDRWMTHLDSLYPHYEFRQHKGYATPRHIKKLQEIGPSPVHRKSFFPVRTFFMEDLFSGLETED